jgi:hypothetical protein
VVATLPNEKIKTVKKVIINVIHTRATYYVFIETRDSLGYTHVSGLTTIAPITWTLSMLTSLWNVRRHDDRFKAREPNPSTDTFPDPVSNTNIRTYIDEARTWPPFTLTSGSISSRLVYQLTPATR